MTEHDDAVETENRDATESEEPPVACELTPDVATAQTERIGELAALYDRAEEVADGYALHFEGTEESLAAVAEFVATELQCCSFAEYAIETAPPYEETTLTITGPEGTKQLFGDGLVGLLEDAAE